MAHRIMRLPEVKVRTGLSRSSIYKFVGLGRFPKPVRIGARASGWIEEEIDAWVSGRVAASRGLAQRSAAPTDSFRS
jgi:prophage regulatory protein